MMQPPIKQPGGLRSEISKSSSTLGSQSRFVVVNGLKAVTQISNDEIRAIEAHFWAELSQLLTTKDTPKGTPCDEREAVRNEQESEYEARV
ncbi:hypothetical protein SAMN05444273_102581 [Litoreibacter ascidiaceicola]|uniref:Uncharacterized protein n=1 Tax=Litoreibacter ascidiaceicola TaxID=1486859 RepID=A0A1M4WCV8_9RHOB|nr:hypothetical protein [Litoreibacter ascidiaceicola]SHE79015.1 hypothetical protein SAMN05444273_102581 [Litoreibacter ascidiaceicola]